jgi:branched-chain amino acid transport system permease protein
MNLATTKRNHVRDIILLLGGFAVVQTAMGLMSGQIATQYYSRIFFLIEINILLTVSLSLINGFTGQFSLGHAGFMAIGAYTSVILTTILPRVITGTPASIHAVTGHAIFLVSIVAAGIMASLFGFIIGFPSLRLRGDYLAIVTLAAGEVIRAGFRFLDVVGGPRGIPGIPAFSSALYIGIIFLISIWIMRNFIYSHWGRACIAVRDNEIAAGCAGINPTFQKVLAFVIGAFFAGVAGSLFAHMSRYINPDNFNILKSLDVLIFLYVGGFRSLAGGIVGAAVFTLVPELLRLVNVENWRMVMYPVILIIAMRFKQDGIMGSHEFGFLIPWKFKEMELRRAEKDDPVQS